MIASLQETDGKTNTGILLLAVLVLAIFVVAGGPPSHYANQVDAQKQLAQAAAGSPENAANKGSSCTPENDRKCNSMCAERTAKDPQKRKWVCDRKIIGNDGKSCRYGCVLAQQNSCGDKQRVEFPDPVRGKCWGCAGDKTVPDNQCEKKPPSYGYTPSPQIDELTGKPVDELVQSISDIRQGELQGDPQVAFKKLRVPEQTFAPAKMAAFDTGLANDVGQPGPAVPKAASPSGVSAPASPVAAGPAAPSQVGSPRPAAPPYGPLTRGNPGVPSGPGSGLGQNAGSGYRSLQPFTPPAGTTPTGQGTQGGLGDFVRNFLGQPTPAHETPQGQLYDGQSVAYAPANSGGIVIAQPTPHLRSIKEIASDVAAETQTSNLPRVDHFARILGRVGGPSTAKTVSTENAAFGRIQDLIVEDEAIRAMFVSEQTAERAKNRVFCRSGETSDACLVRREETAQRVERQTFIEELERRDIPRPALEHFLAVYDGWVRPSPAPKTRATSTPGALFTSEQNPAAGYELETSGGNFVLWFLENVKDATRSLVDTVAGLLLGSRE